MRKTLDIENIEEMRRRAGIEDLELREAIGELRPGDLVYLTVLTGTKSLSGEMLSVQITSIRGSVFRGKLVREPACTVLTQLKVGSLISFGPGHIHSIPRSRHSDEV
jgi:hypothetical protein